MPPKLTTSLALLAALALLAGCAAPPRTASTWGPAPPSEDYIVVTADGYSYLGDNDRLQDARARARQDALKRAVEEGSRIYIRLHARDECGVLKEDVVEQAVAGTLTHVETLVDRLEGNRYHVRIRARVFKEGLEELMHPAPAPTPPATVGASAQGDVTVSFYDYTEVFIPRIYRVLVTAPGVTRVRRLWDGPSYLSYSVAYRGQALEPLEQWLRRELRTSLVVPFRLLTDDRERRIEVHFDAGFD